MNDLIIKEKWYEVLIDECKDIITETIFTSRWALVEGYHKLGERILEDEPKMIQGGSNLRETLQRVAKYLNTSERTLYYACQFVIKYPSLDEVPDGKNISWHKVCNNLLPAPKVDTEEIDPPKGLYNVVIIDPPWPYGTEYDKETRRVASPYKEMTIDKLSGMMIPSHKDCVLWLWTTHKFLLDAFTLASTWGFEYKITMVWDKERLGMGLWLRCQAEFCLLCVKGKPKWNLTNERDIIRATRREHSRKPDEFYSMVKKLCVGKKVDMFGREKREGFDVWGNETEKF